DGMKVRVIGTPKVHEKSGQFRITVEQVELVGEGALKRAFELLKKKLAGEGLFADERKRPIPRFPERIGVIASRESAAFADFKRILGNRWGGVAIQLAHVQVQGAQAIPDIVGAFKYFQTAKPRPDVLVLMRGGGSLEDLQAFNSEEVAYAIFGSKIPVVVGVGHERDESIADYVADLRASTPSNAAELVVPDRREVAYAVDSMAGKIYGTLASLIRGMKSDVDHFVLRLDRMLRSQVHRADALAVRLVAATSSWLGRTRERLEGSIRLLKNLDPRAVLRRGYSITRLANGKILRTATVAVGTELQTILAAGQIRSKVIGKQSSLFDAASHECAARE
ncbi:exodeoxyribonuclease VII large subunit, partial [Candidatus Uhrbacteria bacterium RIFCSPHIGHO2_12_FULL_57_11]